MNQKIENLKGKLIVSCQALPAEPEIIAMDATCTARPGDFW